MIRQAEVRSDELNVWLRTPGQDGRTLEEKINWLAGRNAWASPEGQDEVRSRLLEATVRAAAGFAETSPRPGEDRRRAFERYVSTAWDNELRNLFEERNTSRGRARHRDVDDPAVGRRLTQPEPEGAISNLEIEQLAARLPERWRDAWRAFASALRDGADTTEAYQAAEQQSGVSWPTFVRYLKRHPAFREWAAAA